MLKWLRPTHLPRLRMSLNHSSDLQLLRFLDLAPLLKSISRPVKQLPALRHLQFSLLVRASLLQPASQTKSSRPTSAVKFPGQGSSVPLHQPASKTKSHRPSTMDCGTDPQDTHRPLATDRSLSSDPTDTGSPALHQTKRDSISSLSSGADSCRTNPLWTYTQKKKVNYLKTRISLWLTRINQCRRNKTRDNMQGIRSFMGWSNIPELDNTTNTSDDNPFAGPKTAHPGKVSVKMPTKNASWPS